MILYLILFKGQHANLATFTILSHGYETFDINNTSILSNINNDIDNLTTNLSTFNSDISCNLVNNTTLSTLSTSIDEQHELQLTLMIK